MIGVISRSSSAAIAAVVLLAACQAERVNAPITDTTISPQSTSPPGAPIYADTSTIPVTSEPTRVQATPTIAGVPDILLEEDFSTAETCFESFDNESARADVADDGYVIEVHAADEIANANCETLVASDFILELDVRVEDFEPGGAYYFGVLFRVSGDERYAFVIGSEGGYCVYYAKDEIFVPLTSSTDFNAQCWTNLPSEAMQEGPQRLRVEALADRIDVFLNGELLAVVRDGQLRSGWLGFVAATAGEGGLEVVFDNLIISRK
ncbi:MAG: DUF1080 domain-containing protein [Anaerolineae bacterium]|nr:DUF1080 domain-containing protein [Anaerolineae bacterium]